jgi:polar amino acid transport system permease protein
MAATRDRQKVKETIRFPWRQFPWWLVIIISFLVLMGYQLIVDEHYNRAYVYISGSMGELSDLFSGDMLAFVGRGVSLTLYITFSGFFFAMIIGLLVGLGRISDNFLVRTLAVTYVEFIRGVPTLVLIFTLALVVVPGVLNFIGLEGMGVSNTARGTAALAIIYGAFLAEVFRAGIESVAKGQMEAARSLGMNYRQAMRYIIMPQAIRNILPALGNDFIAMLKDSSLLSVLAVREITQLARLHAGTTFRFRETYLVLTFLYLLMTISLSLLLRWYERRISGGK